MQIGVGFVCQIVRDIQVVFETEDNGFQWMFRTFQKVVTSLSTFLSCLRSTPLVMGERRGIFYHIAPSEIM
jgi:hypothetical protein